MLRILRRLLDDVYLAGGVVGAVFLIAILGLILAQMIARWTGNVFPGGTDYAGYADSGAFRSSISVQIDHCFRSKLHSDSGGEPITFSVRTGTRQGS